MEQPIFPLRSSEADCSRHCDKKFRIDNDKQVCEVSKFPRNTAILPIGKSSPREKWNPKLAPFYERNVCQGTSPLAYISFLNLENFTLVKNSEN